MPTLTQIKETKKGRFALFFDGEFAFSLDEETYVKAHLNPDDVLEDWQIDELRRQSDTARPVLRYYNDAFLSRNMSSCLTLAVVFYSLWSVDEANAGTHLVWTVPLVLCLCLKYSLTVEGNSDGDPVEVIYGDKVLLVLIALFAAVTTALLYGV